MTNTATFFAAILWCALSVAPAGAQERFHTVDQARVAGAPGLRVITVRDALLKRCYTVFVGDPGGLGETRTTPPQDVDAARTVRDRRLADLLHTYENDRSAIPGTLAPNPYLYEWQAAAAQLEYALIVLDREFARLEQQMDRMTDASRTAVSAMPTPCTPSDERAKP